MSKRGDTSKKCGLQNGTCWLVEPMPNKDHVFRKVIVVVLRERVVYFTNHHTSKDSVRFLDAWSWYQHAWLKRFVKQLFAGKIKIISGWYKHSRFVGRRKKKYFKTAKQKGTALSHNIWVKSVFDIPIWECHIWVPIGSAVKLYTNVFLGWIGHCVTYGTPSMNGVSFWYIPCQWMVELSLSKSFFTATRMVSPLQT